MDKSDAIIAAVKAVFPEAEIRVCYFHVMQAWKRWLRKGESGITTGKRCAVTLWSRTLAVCAEPCAATRAYTLRLRRLFLTMAIRRGEPQGADCHGPRHVHCHVGGPLPGSTKEVREATRRTERAAHNQCWRGRWGTVDIVRGVRIVV
jgi:hypothetical protein